MTGETILLNTFYAFWFILGEYFVLLMAFAFVVSIFAVFIWILTK